MYNYSIVVDIMSTSSPATLLYGDIVVNIAGDLLSDAISSIATIFNVQAAQVTVKKIKYIQEILKISEGE